MHEYWMENAYLVNGTCEKDTGLEIDSKVNTSQQRNIM